MKIQVTGIGSYRMLGCKIVEVWNDKDSVPYYTEKMENVVVFRNTVLGNVTTLQVVLFHNNGDSLTIPWEGNDIIEFKNKIKEVLKSNNRVLSQYVKAEYNITESIGVTTEILCNVDYKVCPKYIVEHKGELSYSNTGSLTKALPYTLETDVTVYSKNITRNDIRLAKENENRTPDDWTGYIP